MNPLLPFTLEEYKANPERLRHESGRRATWSEEVRGNLLIQWTGRDYPLLYTLKSNHHTFLRLAPKEPKKMNVRLYRNRDGTICAAVTNAKTALDYSGAHPWASDPIQIPLYEEQK